MTHDDRRKKDEAGKYILNFGKYKGRSIRAIAESDEGLKYLDYLRGTKECDFMLLEDINDYLNYGPVARRLDELVED